MAHRMLHPGISRDDKEARQPRAQEYEECRNPVRLRPHALLAEQKYAEKTGLQEKGKHAFHGQRLADHSSGGFRKSRPVGPELKLHGNTGDHTHSEADPEDLGPESRRSIVLIV